VTKAARTLTIWSMRLVRPLIAALLALALFALPAGISAAAEIVPPGNSAASQYTEAFPTTGGERETEDHSGKAVPAKALGARNAKQLESKGKDGKAVAEFAAETAPAPVVTETSPPSSGDSQPGSGDGGGKEKDDNGAAGGGKGGNGGGGGGTGSPAAKNDGSATATIVTASVEKPSGSSGFSEVLGEATGSSSGKLGLFLPLIVIGAVIWSLFYLWRQRQQGQRVA
jgi:hypothetical protein